MRILWESHENLVRSSWDHCTLMRISWENFSLVRISWEFSASINLHIQSFHEKRPKILMRISWHSHEILMRKRSNFHVKKDSRESHEKLMRNLTRSSWKFENLMRKRSNFHVKTKISWDSHEIWWKAHEILMRIVDNFHFLMRISWDSHEYSWEFL